MRPNEEAPEVRDALSKAEEYGRLSEGAVDPADKEQFERMRRKWMGIAEGWRFIASVADRR